MIIVYYHFLLFDNIAGEIFSPYTKATEVNSVEKNDKKIMLPQVDQICRKETFQTFYYFLVLFGRKIKHHFFPIKQA